MKKFIFVSLMLFGMLSIVNAQLDRDVWNNKYGPNDTLNHTGSKVQRAKVVTPYYFSSQYSVKMAVDTGSSGHIPTKYVTPKIYSGSDTTNSVAIKAGDVFIKNGTDVFIAKAAGRGKWVKLN